MAFSLKLSLSLVLFFSLLFLPPKSVARKREVKKWEFGGEKKMVLGSRPPGCKNKCLSCRPCMATLVVPVHKNKAFKAATATAAADRDEDDGYYLLSWKCRCGSKIYQP